MDFLDRLADLCREGALIIYAWALLKRYPWTGHSAIIGKLKRDWQDMDAVLVYFGGKRKEAVSEYESFVQGG